MTTPVTGSVHIDAPADAVYAMVSDVNRMGEWSPETHRVTWLPGPKGPVVGARFRGHNRLGLARWSTTCTVVEADPVTRSFAFDVTTLLSIPVAQWRYDVVPDGDGCVVTEATQDRRPWFIAISSVFIGVADRNKHNVENIRKTLERLKACAEATLVKDA